MHWLGNAAVRAGLKGAPALTVPKNTPLLEAWETVSRSLGLAPSDLAHKVAADAKVRAANFALADPKSLRLIPQRLARRFNVFPLHDDDREILVATADPGDMDVEQSLAFASGRRVVFELAAPHQITQAVNTGYSAQRPMERALLDFDAELADVVRVVEELEPEVVAAHEVEAAPVVKLTNLVLRDAVMQRASDIHIEPGEGSGAVRFRIDGVLRHHMYLPTPALNRVVSRIKVLSRLDIADRIRPQDGRTKIQVDGKTYDLRVSTVPTRDAEKAVIRILRPEGSATLEDVGVSPNELERLRRLLALREGIVLVTGPTGSGKTTTLYAAIREIANGLVNVMTVEDPVEYELPSISQIQVDIKRGVTFGSALRAILRQDPDVIFIGEIRDLETAQIAVQAAMTGHLVLATLHTNDAMSAVARLVDLGLDRPSIASTLRGSLAQRLVRRLCTECMVTVNGDLTDEETRLAARFGIRPVVRAVGCARCASTGYFGRLPIDEVAIVTPLLAEEIANGSTALALQRLAHSGGMRTLREVALEQVVAGRTTLQEVDRVVGDDGSGTADSAAEGVPEITPNTILVVDDDSVERQLISAVLQKNGYRVEVAVDGAAALEQLRDAARFSMVLTDLHMPNMDGEMLLKRVRGITRALPLPVMVVTGSSEVDMEAKLIEAGADDYIRKPIDPSRLIARVKAALRRAAA